MDFCSKQFLFYFVPIVFALYCIVSNKMRGFAILVVSLFLYSWGDKFCLLVLLALITVNYFLSIQIGRSVQSSARVQFLVTAILINLAVLFVFKYLSFFLQVISPLLQMAGLGITSIQPLHVPLGISFLIFQAIAYVIDVYREEFPPQKNIVKFSIFIAMFPKMTAGPIIRYREIEESLESPEVSLDNFICGAKRIIVGMGKKLIIADTLSLTADKIFLIPSGELTFAGAWLGIICYTLQLYFDFSGYTDMAIGLGRIFGFSLRENFDYPYIAKSLTEFWRRWHISLSTWFRDYLYVPLSYALVTDNVRQKMAEGKYKTNYRSLFSIIVVFTLCGLWHGANWNFIIWGMLHGIVLAFENWKLGRFLKKSWPPLAHLYLLTVIMVSWVFFRLSTISEAIYFLKVLAGYFGASGNISQLRTYLHIELILVLGFAVLGAMPVARLTMDCLRRIFLSFSLRGWLSENTGRQVITFAESFIFAMVFLAALQAVTGTAKPFIYAQF